MTDNKAYDVIIAGGSYAGLSAAMALGRSLRRVLVLDTGKPCNRQTPHSHNFITHDGEKPAVIAQKAKEQVLRYPSVSWRNTSAEKARKEGPLFVVTTGDGLEVTARKLIVATGVEDRLPEIPGFAQAWGISVIHCPYCHGYEVRNETTGILANGENAAHYAQLIRNWTSDLTILTNGPSTISPDVVEKIKQHGIPIVEKKIATLVHQDGYLSQVEFDDGSSFPLTALYSRPEMRQQCSVPESLGCEVTEHGLLKTDGFQKTAVPGLFVCGDASSMMRSVANAVATGNVAGAMANSELIQEEFNS